MARTKKQSTLKAAITCGNCPYTLLCYTDRLEKRFVVYICPVCGLMRLASSTNIESDDDCDPAQIHCNQRQPSTSQQAAFRTYVLKQRKFPTSDEMVLRETQLRWKGTQNTYLYLCDVCSARYAPWEVSILDAGEPP